MAQYFTDQAELYLIEKKPNEKWDSRDIQNKAESMVRNALRKLCVKSTRNSHGNFYNIGIGWIRRCGPGKYTLTEFGKKNIFELKVKEVYVPKGRRPGNPRKSQYSGTQQTLNQNILDLAKKLKKNTPKALSPEQTIGYKKALEKLIEIVESTDD